MDIFTAEFKKYTVQNKHRLALIAVMALGVFFRLAFWNAQGITDDEIYTMASASGYNLHLFSWWPDSYSIPFDPELPVKAAYYRNDILKLYEPEIFWDGIYNNIQGPVYPLLIRYIRNLLNPNAIQLRLISVIASILTLPFAYIIGKQIKDKHFGLLVTTIVAFSGMLIYYSHIARLYSILILLVMICTWALFKIAPLRLSPASHNEEAVEHPKPSRINWAVLVITCLLCIYTHYAFFFTMAFFFCYLVWQAKSTQHLRVPLFVSTIMIALGCMPLMPIYHLQSEYQQTYGHFSAEGLWSISSLVLALGKHLTVLLTYKNVILQIIVGVILGVGMIAGLVLKKDLPLVKFGLIWSLFCFLPFIAIDLIKHTHYIRTSRYFLPMLPILILIYAYVFDNLAKISKNFLLWLLVVILIGNSFLISKGDFSHFYGFSNTPFIKSSRFINTYLSDHDLVIVTNSGVNTIGISQYLSQQADIIGISRKNPGINWQDEDLAKRLAFLTQGRHRVWIVFKRPSKHLKHQIETWMLEEFEPIRSKKIQNDTKVVLWGRRKPKTEEQISTL